MVSTTLVSPDPNTPSSATSCASARCSCTATAAGAVPPSVVRAATIDGMSSASVMSCSKSGLASWNTSNGRSSRLQPRFSHQDRGPHRHVCLAEQQARQRVIGNIGGKVLPHSRHGILVDGQVEIIPAITDRHCASVWAVSSALLHPPRSPCCYKRRQAFIVTRQHAGCHRLGRSCRG